MLFGRNKAQNAKTDNNWSDVIKNLSPIEAFIWRHPYEDFNTNSTLIVQPGELAVFVKNGVVQNKFTNGTYNLSTENYPFISKLRNYFTGGVSSFSAVVYFVKITSGIEIKWGTESPIQVRDKVVGVATKIRCRGSYKLQVANVDTFFQKLLGANIAVFDQQEVEYFFINEFQRHIRTSLTKELNSLETEILGIEARIDEFSCKLEPVIENIVSPYGLHCMRFNISAMDVEDDELRRKYDEIGMGVVAKVRNAHADKEVMNVLSESWGKQQSVNILGNLSIADGNSVAGAGASLGMGVAVGGVMANLANQMLKPEGTINNNKSLSALKELKGMLDAELITKDEYEMKKREILSRI